MFYRRDARIYCGQITGRKRVILRGDGEFISWESVKVAIEEGYDFIFGNKACNPPFESKGWGQACRFVAMRIPKEEKARGEETQLKLFKDSEYVYRIFVTNITWKPHKVIMEYDKRADCENLIGEAKREGLSAIPTGKFSSNYAYFQIVMLSYNIGDQ